MRGQKIPYKEQMPHFKVLSCEVAKKKSFVFGTKSWYIRIPRNLPAADGTLAMICTPTPSRSFTKR